MPRSRPACQARAPKTHRLEATPATSPTATTGPTRRRSLRIASGDIIDVDTLLTNTPAGLCARVCPRKIQESLKRSRAEFPQGDRDRGPGGHILTGPVFVEGAEPGDALEVKILSIDFAIDYGYNGCSGFLPRELRPTRGRARRSSRSTEAMTAEFMPGIVIPLRPFFGSMGVAPAPEVGRVSSNPPGVHAGNLDNKELVAGTTLFIPVLVPGALFEIGDGHAAQGDGEVDQTAIETSLRGTPAADRPQGHEAQLAARRDADRLHRMATDPDLDARDHDRHSGDGGLSGRDARAHEARRPTSWSASPETSP